jgi:hypothetical protein
VVEGAAEADVRRDGVEDLLARDPVALPRAVAQQLPARLGREPEEAEHDLGPILLVSFGRKLRAKPNWYYDLYKTLCSNFSKICG